MAGSSAPVSTAASSGSAFASAAVQSTSPRLSAAPTASTVRKPAHRARVASTLSMPLSSTIASVAPLSLMRYSSASGPNSIESGIATAPIRWIAMCATAVSMRWGMTMATRSPRATPSPRKTAASKPASRSSSA